MPDYASLGFEAVLELLAPMCRKAAHAYFAVFRCHTPEDLYQVAVTGLWLAHERLRAGRLSQPERFPGYARRMVRSELLRYLCSTNYLVSIPEEEIRRRRRGAPALADRLRQTQPLSLDGPAPVEPRYPRDVALGEQVQAPAQDPDLGLDIRAALARVPQARLTLLLMRAAGYEPSEIAQAVGLATKSVYTHLWTARNEFRKALGA